METHLIIIGYLFITLSFLHIFLPKYSNWKKELSQLSLFNKQIMQVHTFFIALTVLMMGILCITCAKEIATTSLGKKISFGLGIFWSIRLLSQLFWYSKKLWKGKNFETIIHILATSLWLYLTYVFFKNSMS